VERNLHLFNKIRNNDFESLILYDEKAQNTFSGFDDEFNTNKLVFSTNHC
jgi:hypothetical protein